MPTSSYPLERLLGRVLSPFENFLSRTSAGGIVLLLATVAALVVASIVGDEAFHHFWDHPLGVRSTAFTLELSWHHWVNDGLMALFFLAVGLELKREILVGELSSWHEAALPVIAAAGGIAVPAAIYVAFNWGGAGASGWGIPMATDIAFAIGILVLLGKRAPRGLVVFLTALAIADDLAAVLIIAVFYTAQLDTRALGLAAVTTIGLVMLNRGGVRHPLPYVVLGLMLWYFMLRSGVHATLSGIVLAVAIPARGRVLPSEYAEHLRRLQARLEADVRDTRTPEDPLRNAGLAHLASAMERAAVAVQSPLQRIGDAVTPWVTFVVVPLFALSNAGIDLRGVDYTRAFVDPVTLGVLFGLAVGKFAGIAAASALAARAGMGRLPEGVSWQQLLGAAWLAGIGFTMSLFIAQLAFTDAVLIEDAKLGILGGSAIAAVIGVIWLYYAGARSLKP